jgi:hypothetical protein
MCKNFSFQQFSILLLLVLISLPTSASPKSEKTLPAYFVSELTSINLRTGIWEFSDFSLKQDTARPGVGLFGVGLGRRYTFSDKFRLELNVGLNFGSAKQDTFFYDYFSRYKFLNFHVSPSIQITIPAPEKVSPYIALGGGFDFVRTSEHFYALADPAQEIRFSDFGTSTYKRWCGHLEAGFGFDFLINPDFGISLGYLFKYWVPVAFDYSRDTPLQTIPYKERFFTHALVVKLLFSFGK